MRRFYAIVVFGLMALATAPIALGQAVQENGYSEGGVLGAGGGGGGAGGVAASGGALPFTGMDLLFVAIAGVALLVAGLVLRRSRTAE